MPHPRIIRPSASHIADEKGFLKLESLYKFPQAGAIREKFPGSLKLVQHIINGGYGSIWLTRCSIQGKLYVAKVCGTLEPSSSTELSAPDIANAELYFHGHPRGRALAEANAMANVVAVGEFQPLNLEGIEFGTCLIFEYFGADLDTMILNIVDHCELLPECLIWSFLCQSVLICHKLTMELKGMESIIHCDIKPDNLFISLEGQEDNPDLVTKWPRLRLADFGLSHTLRSHEDSVKSISGVAPFNAPENALGIHTRRSDLWCMVHSVYCLASAGAPARPRLPWVNDNEALFNGWKSYSNRVLQDRNAPVVVHRIPGYSGKLNAAFEFLLLAKTLTSSRALAYLDQEGARELAENVTPVPRYMFHGLLERMGSENVPPTMKELIE